MLQPIQPFRPRVPTSNARAQVTLDIPSPIGGLNFRDPISEMAPTDATVLNDFIIRPFGLELRSGWSEHCVEVGSAVSTIETLLTYQAPATANDKLFACVGDKIYDVTTFNTPTLALTEAAANNGRWESTMFVNNAGAFLIAVNNSDGGYYTYDTVGGWVQRTPAGFPSNSITSVIAWKNRLWFTFENDSRGFYLAIGAIDGTATAFDFGPQLKHGGTLAGISNWTHDAGEGIDDYQVVFGTNGDVIVYQGYDPSAVTTYQLKGIWWIGSVPTGHRWWSQVNGDVWALSQNGVVPISQLVNGRFSDSDYLNPLTSKIQTELGPFVVSTMDDVAWEMIRVPHIDAIMLKAPPQPNSTWKNYILNQASGAWSVFTKMPIFTGVQFQGVFYFGTNDGRVCTGLSSTDATDGKTIAGVAGETLEGEVQGGFEAFGSGSTLKRFLMCRPVFISDAAPSVRMQMNTEYSYSTTAGSPAFAEPGTGVWDAGTWDTAAWSGSANTYASWVGLQGISYRGSLRLVVRGVPGTNYASSQILVQPGGLL